jgi:hypothetical protein
MKKQAQSKIAIFLIIISGLLFALIGGLAIWADVEALLFNSARRSTERLSSLRCPSFITAEETGIISASFTNPSERTINPLIRTYVTDGFVILMQETEEKLELSPGETETVEIKVTASNAAFNRLILARMHQLSYGPLPYRNASCGIFVIDIPIFTGKQIVFLASVIAIIASLMGFWLWIDSNKPIVWDRLTNLYQLAAWVLLGAAIFIVGLLSLWLPGVLMIVVWLLLGIGLITQKILSSKKDHNPNEGY